MMGRSQEICHSACPVVIAGERAKPRSSHYLIVSCSQRPACIWRIEWSLFCCSCGTCWSSPVVPWGMIFEEHWARASLAYPIFATRMQIFWWRCCRNESWIVINRTFSWIPCKSCRQRRGCTYCSMPFNGVLEYSVKPVLLFALCFVLYPGSRRCADVSL